MKPLFDRAFYINRSTEGLQNASRGSNSSEPLVDNKPWKTGRDIFVEAGKSGKALPLIFSHYAELTFWAVAVDIVRTGKTTTFTFAHLQEIENRERRDLIVASTGRELPNDFIRSYAIVLTPDFLGTHHAVRDLEGLPIASDANTLAEDLKSIIKQNIGPTTKDALVSARVGQGKFRTQVLELWGNRCSVTGSLTQDAIRASHIKPWRESTNDERLDAHNGLPLVASLDALFDAGLISFETSGKLIVSPQLEKRERKLFAVDGKSLTKRPNAKMAAYLEYHRNRALRK